MENYKEILQSLKELKSLFDDGVITETEFTKMKEMIFSSDEKDGKELRQIINGTFESSEDVVFESSAMNNKGIDTPVFLSDDYMLPLRYDENKMIYLAENLPDDFYHKQLTFYDYQLYEKEITEKERIEKEKRIIREKLMKQEDELVAKKYDLLSEIRETTGIFAGKKKKELEKELQKVLSELAEVKEKYESV